MKKVICLAAMAVILMSCFSVFCSAELANEQALIQKILPNHNIDAVCEGDINNDGNIEYAVFSHVKGTEATEGESADAVQYYFDLSVFTKQGSEMKLLWTDKGAYGYYQGLLSPQNVLVGIGEILNNGTKYLVVRFENDDSYDLLKWKEGKLVIDKEISLANGKVHEYDQNKKKPKKEFMYGEFLIVKENNGTKLKILVSNAEEKVIKISGNIYVIEREGPPSDKL